MGQSSDTNFTISKTSNNKYSVVVTTTTDNAEIPEHVEFDIDVFTKTIRLGDKIIAQYGVMGKQDVADKKYTHSNHKNPMNDTKVVVASTVQNRNKSKSRSKSRSKVGLISITQKNIHYVFNKSRSIFANWIVWVLQKILSTIYYEVFSFAGPLSLPVWGIILCLIPGAFPFVEKTGIYMLAWILETGKTVNIGSKIMQTVINQLSQLGILYKFRYPGFITAIRNWSIFSSNTLSSVIKSLELNGYNTGLINNLIDWWNNPILYSGTNYMIRLL